MYIHIFIIPKYRFRHSPTGRARGSLPVFVGGLVYRSKRNEVIEKIWQELDWGKFIDLKKIKKELANIKTVKVLFKEKKININY